MELIISLYLISTSINEDFLHIVEILDKPFNSEKIKELAEIFIQILEKFIKFKDDVTHTRRKQVFLAFRVLNNLNFNNY